MSWIDNHLNRIIERKEKVKERVTGRDNIIFNMQLVSYTATFILALAFIFSLIFGPYNIVTNVMYYEGKDDNVSSSVVGYCKYQETEVDKILCVNNFVNDNFKYVVTKDILSPDELIENGGDCKSWSNFYMITLRQLGIKVTQNFDAIDNHTFVIADIEEGYCIIDQKSVDCHRLGPLPVCKDNENCIILN